MIKIKTMQQNTIKIDGREEDSGYEANSERLHQSAKRNKMERETYLRRGHPHYPFENKGHEEEVPNIQPTNNARQETAMHVDSVCKVI